MFYCRVLAALLWTCRTVALQLQPSEKIRLSFANSVWGRKDLKLPPGYYGNAFAFPAKVSRAGDLCRKPLGYAVELVKKAKARINGEYIKSVADLMVLKGPPGYTLEWNYIVVDLSRAGIDEVDFGWGKPIYGGPTGLAVAYLISNLARFKNSKGEDGIAVCLWLPLPVMERFQRELPKMTRDSPETTYRKNASIL